MFYRFLVQSAKELQWLFMQQSHVASEKHERHIPMHYVLPEYTQERYLI